ncbi:hypothetical protein FOZ62_010443, partial [Perkinsus olseni]
MPRAPRSSAADTKKLRSGPLLEDLKADAEAGISKVPREKKGRHRGTGGPDEGMESVPSKITERILKAAQQQQLEEAEDGDAKTPEVEAGEVEVDEEGRVRIGAEVTEADEAAQAQFRSNEE